MWDRTRRFEKLRSCESRYSKVIEVFDGEDAIQTRFAMTPPVPGTTCDLRRKLRACPEYSGPTVSSGSDTPVLELVRITAKKATYYHPK